MHTIDVEPDPTSPHRTSRSALWLWVAAVVVVAVAVVAAVLWWPNGMADDPTSPHRTSRSALWLWVAAVAVVAVAVVAAVLWWPNGMADDPPWGLDQVDMPNTEADVIAVLEALPAVDGRSPSFSNEDGWVFATYYESEAEEVRVAVSAMYDPGLRDAFPEWNVVEGAVDSNSDLLWMTPFEDEGGFGMMWAASDGSWLFILEANTADLRTKLVNAFIEATNQ